MFERPLKSIVTSKLEETLSKSITELVGENYTVSIKKLDFECGNGVSADMFDSMDMQIHVCKKQEDTQF